MRIFSLLMAALFCFAARASALPSIPDDALIGLWRFQTKFASPYQGPLVITRAGSRWHTALADESADARTQDGQIRFDFPHHRGRFFASPGSGSGAIGGFWLQDIGGVSDPNVPEGAVQPLASPLTLTLGKDGAWRGWVRPLDRRFTIYLQVFRDDKGLVGAFRNPQINSNGGTSQFRVARDGDKIHFSAKPDPNNDEITHDANILHAPDRLQLDWDDLGHAIEFMRIMPGDASEFFTRPPGEPSYVYRVPARTGDGWQPARAGAVGMDEAALTKFVQSLVDADPAARRPQLIHSVLIAYRGKLVLEEYFHGFNRDTPHDIRSAGKTFASVMLGAAMMQHAHIAPGSSIYDIMKSSEPFANADPRKSQITLAQLMTHTSGLACDDNDNRSPGAEGRMQSQNAQPDWWKYTLDLPMAHDPGATYAYCSAGINLIGGALTTVTHTWLPEYFDRTIARPLGFGPYYWNLTPSGEGYLGGGAFIRPRDLLKVGQAYLDGGVWRGRRIVPASWVKDSTASRVKVSPATTGLTPEQFANFYGDAEDAFAWHLASLKTPSHTYAAYGASGNGGQLLVVVPELDLAVVFTGGNYGQGGIWNKWRDQMIPDQIIPAIMRRAQ